MLFIVLCVPALPRAGAAQTPRGTSARAALEARHLADFADAGITESSGLAASRRHPGILWTIEDSGAEPVLHATDTTGADLGTWRVTGAANLDWEALAIGDCPAGSCLFIGDIGDNRATRAQVTIYRIAEPDPEAPSRRTRPATRVAVTYPGGPRDAEAMVVLPGGDLLIVSKSRNSAPHLYRVPSGAWRAPTPARASDLGPLPIPSGSLADLVTDAALSPDGRRVAIRTYASIYFFRLDGGYRLSADAAVPACGIFGIEPQGEGLAWLDATHLVTSSEDNFGLRGGLGLVRCEGS